MGTGPDGRPVISKLAPPGPDADALAHEAEILRLAAHPGVIEVVAAGSTPDGGFRLDTRLAGVRTLSGLRPRVEEAAGIAAAVAATVADLHGIGIVHGAVEPGHVVLDGRGAPILCGFGRGCRGASVAPTDDVAGLGEVLAALVGDAAEVEPIPDRRFGRRSSWSAGVARRALLNLADQARADDPGVRPTARAFSGAVLAAIPAARLPGGEPAVTSGAAEERTADETQHPVPRSGVRAGPPARTVRIGAAVAGLALLGYGVSATFGSAGTPDLSAPSGPGSTPVPVAPAPPVMEPTTADTLRLLECPAIDTTGADPDGDGCLSPVTIDGGVVEVDGVRYGVGAPGDAIAIGDWDCNGSATVAAVRPATGEVFVFDGWAAPGNDLVVAASARIAGAREAMADDADGDGCPALVVLTSDGARSEVTA
jgi:hypothetical protein